MLLLDDIIDNGVRIKDEFLVRNATKDEGSRVTFGVYPGTAVFFSVVVTTTYPDANGSGKLIEGQFQNRIPWVFSFMYLSLNSFLFANQCLKIQFKK